jgi:hypothetical protein
MFPRHCNPKDEFWGKNASKFGPVVGRTLDFYGTFIKNLGEGLGDRVQVTEKRGQQAGHIGWDIGRFT